MQESFRKAELLTDPEYKTKLLKLMIIHKYKKTTTVITSQSKPLGK